MSEKKWEILDIISGDLQAEIIRGMLEANEIPVVLIQEGAGRSVYRVAIGPLANVQVMVPSKFLNDAQKILEEYYAAIYPDQDDRSIFPNSNDNDMNE